MQGIHQRPGAHGGPSQRQGHGGADGDGAPSEMEQKLDMMAMSLRGNQEEAEGVRKGLMMLQPFQHQGGEEARAVPQGQQRPSAARPSPSAHIRAHVEQNDLGGTHAHSPAPRSRPHVSSVPESRASVRGGAGDGEGEVGRQDRLGGGCPPDYLAQVQFQPEHSQS